jgi:sugar transferase EpsL
MSAQVVQPTMPISKRLLDLALTVPALVVLSPVLFLIGLAVLITQGPPILFRQLRPGYRGQPFVVIKFRTMRTERTDDGALLPDEDRLTSLGRFLRSFSLDELPELWNVLKGEMSLVGPRPLLMQYIDRYTPEQARRHDVVPGITGWAQIHGRNAVTWEDKFSLDVWYVDHWRFGLDVKILLMTVWKVLTREGISQPGQATAEEFMGDTHRGASDERT